MQKNTGRETRRCIPGPEGGYPPTPPTTLFADGNHPPPMGVGGYPDTPPSSKSKISR